MYLKAAALEWSDLMERFSASWDIVLPSLLMIRKLTNIIKH